ncbi:MAG: transketolase family protein [Limnochordia bacterium]|jgi:transketolase
MTAMKEIRTAFCEALIEIAKENEDLVVITPDLMGPLGLTPFAEALPGQFFNLGIAEQNAAGFAAGLALEGRIPWLVSFATFAAGRAYEQIRVNAAYMNTNVKICGMAAGITAGLTGPTHMAIEDLALMRALPNMQILSPADAHSVYGAVKLAVETPGPVYLRLGRPPEPVIYPERTELVLGGSNRLREGHDLALLATGLSLYPCLQAAEILEERGISARVVDLYSIKPIDGEEVIKAAQETKGIITVEEHTVCGGLGSLVSEIVTAHHPCRVVSMGIQDTWVPAGDPGELRSLVGLDAPRIAQEAERFLAT